jgi:uncharacterized integral membrane protein
MENGTASTSQGRMGGADIVRRIIIIIVAILVTLLIVFMILNFQRWVSIDFLVGSVRTRVVWALLVPFILGLLIGWLSGRIKIRR